MIDILHNRLSTTHFQNSWHYSPVVQWQNRWLLTTQFRFESWRESQEQNKQIAYTFLLHLRQKCMQLFMLLWWNGIHSRLKICLPHGIKGSSPFRSTFVHWEHNGVCGGMVYTPGCGPGSCEDNASSSLVIHPDTGWQASPKGAKSSSSQKVLSWRDASENLVNPTYGVVVCECGKCMCNRDVDSKSRRARNCSTTLLSSPQGSHLYVVSDVTKTLQHK